MATVGWVLLAIVGLTVLSLPKVLIDVAWEKEGKWLIAAYIVNAICIALAGLAGLYAVITGASRLLDENWQVALLAGGATAFVIYFYIAKGEARQKTELTPKVAQEILRQFAEVLAEGTPEGEIARYESNLPCSKERIKQACKVVLAYLIEYDAISQDYATNLLSMVLHIGSFEPDDKAKRINTLKANGEPNWWKDFNQIDVATRTELDEFIEQVEALDSTDPLFHQHVYSLIGIEYSPRLKRSFREFYLEESR
jgi:hypothetical protein